MISNQKIGLIAGNGSFPALFAKAARERNVEVVACGIDGETLPEVKGLVEKYYELRLGELGKLIKILKDERVEKAVMVGGVRKVRLFKEIFSLDIEAMKLLWDMRDKRDNSLLGALIQRLEREGIEFLSSATYLEDCLAKPGVLTKRASTDGESQDIEFGKVIAKELSRYDVGLTAVVKDKVVLALEAVEGTDETIRRGAALGGAGCVVVKVARPNQDLRYDLPVIGPQTIKTLKDCKVSCLAIEAQKTLIAEKELTIREADLAGVSVVAF